MSKFIFNTEWTDLLQGCREWVRLEVYEGIIEYVRTGTPPKLRTQAGAVLRCIIREMDRDGLLLTADDNTSPVADIPEGTEHLPLHTATGAECGGVHPKGKETADEAPRARNNSLIAYSIDNKKKKNKQKKDFAVSSVPDSLFLKFYSLYGRDIDKPRVWSKWQRLTEEEKKKIMDYVPLYVAATPDKRYRRAPLTFLEKRTWENELPPVAAPKPADAAKEQRRKYEQQCISRSIAEASRRPPTKEEEREKRRQQLLGYVRAVKENPKSIMRDILVKVKEKGELDELGIEWNPEED